MRKIVYCSDRGAHWRFLVLIVLVLVAGVRDVAGQVEASIIGHVQDESGASMPGVTVTATSPALQVKQVTAVTDATGDYRLASLPIGIYEVQFELPGFGTIRRTGVRLTAGFVARIDEALKVATVSESVTVSGRAPVVDVSSASPRTVLTKEILEELPTTKNSIISLVAQVPGVQTTSGRFDVGGSLFAATPSLNVLGRTGDNFVMVDGVLITAAGGGTNGNYADFTSFEEAQVQVVGSGAEMPSNGIWINAIVKSGGNDFHGNGSYGLTGPWAEGSNLDAALKARGAVTGNDLIKRRDFGGDLGGRIVSNKLWFYTNGRFPENDVYSAGCFKPDGSRGNDYTGGGYGTGKASYQLTSSQRLSGLYQWNRKFRESGCTNLNAWESRSRQDQTGVVRTAGWMATFGKVFAAAHYGYWDFYAPLTGFAPADHPSTFDQVTLKNTGGQVPTPWTDSMYRHSVNSTIVTFKPDVFFGDHEFKGGLDYTMPTQATAYLSRAASGGDYSLIVKSGVPFQMVAYNNPTQGIDKAPFLGLYLQDTWHTGRRLTLNLGLRYDRSRAYSPVQSRVAGTFAEAATFPYAEAPTWNAFAPRIHFAYDIAGQGKTVLKGGWGLFNAMRSTTDTRSSNPNSRVTTTYLWHDVNENLNYEPGEANLNLDPGNTDFVSRTGGPSRLLNPNERQPKTNEFSLTLERELMQNFGIQVMGVYTRQSNLRMLQEVNRPYSSYSIPVTVPDPGPTGNQPTGALVTYYQYPAAYNGAFFGITMPVNAYANSWKSVSIAATKRLSRNWQAMASYAGTKSNMRYRSEYTVQTPNAEIFGGNKTWVSWAKAGGSYHFPLGLMAAVNFQATKGDPTQRTVLVTGGSTIPSRVTAVEAWGATHYDNAYMLDVRAEKSVKLPHNAKGTVRFDVFNTLNSNTITSAVWQSGPSFGRTSAFSATSAVTPYIPPRIAVMTFTVVF